MAFKIYNFFDLRRITLLVYLTIPLIATTNIDCNGKAFHCVNTTHFMICVDLGNGVSSTIEDFLIPCPPRTICQSTNRFECEFAPVTLTPAPSLNVISIQEASVATNSPVTTTAKQQSTVGLYLEEIYNTVSTSTLYDIVTEQPGSLFDTTLRNNKTAKYTEVNEPTEPIPDLTTVGNIRSETENAIESEPITDFFDHQDDFFINVNTNTTEVNETLPLNTPATEEIITTAATNHITRQDVTIRTNETVLNDAVTTTDNYDAFTESVISTTDIPMSEIISSTITDNPVTTTGHLFNENVFTKSHSKPAYEKTDTALNNRKTDDSTTQNKNTNSQSLVTINDYDISNFVSTIFDQDPGTTESSSIIGSTESEQPLENGVTSTPIPYLYETTSFYIKESTKDTIQSRETYGESLLTIIDYPISNKEATKFDQDPVTTDSSPIIASAQAEKPFDKEVTSITLPYLNETTALSIKDSTGSNIESMGKYGESLKTTTEHRISNFETTKYDQDPVTNESTQIIASAQSEQSLDTEVTSIKIPYLYETTAFLIEDSTGYNIESKGTYVESLETKTEHRISNFETTKFDQDPVTTESFPIYGTTENMQTFEPEVASTMPYLYDTTTTSKNERTESMQSSTTYEQLSTNGDLLEITFDVIKITEPTINMPKDYEIDIENNIKTTDAIFADQKYTTSQKTSRVNDNIDVVTDTLITESTMAEEPSTYDDILHQSTVTSLLATPDFILTNDPSNNYINRETVQSDSESIPTNFTKMMWNTSTINNELEEISSFHIYTISPSSVTVPVKNDEATTNPVSDFDYDYNTINYDSLNQNHTTNVSLEPKEIIDMGTISYHEAVQGTFGTPNQYEKTSDVTDTSTNLAENYSPLEFTTEIVSTMPAAIDVENLGVDTKNLAVNTDIYSEVKQYTNFPETLMFGELDTDIIAIRSNKNESESLKENTLQYTDVTTSFPATYEHFNAPSNEDNLVQTFANLTIEELSTRTNESNSQMNLKEQIASETLTNANRSESDIHEGRIIDKVELSTASLPSIPTEIYSTNLINENRYGFTTVLYIDNKQYLKTEEPYKTIVYNPTISSAPNLEQTPLSSIVEIHSSTKATIVEQERLNIMPSVTSSYREILSERNDDISNLNMEQNSDVTVIASHNIQNPDKNQIMTNVPEIKRETVNPLFTSLFPQFFTTKMEPNLYKNVEDQSLSQSINLGLPISTTVNSVTDVLLSTEKSVESDAIPSTVKSATIASNTKRINSASHLAMSIETEQPVFTNAAQNGLILMPFVDDVVLEAPVSTLSPQFEVNDGLNLHNIGTSPPSVNIIAQELSNSTPSGNLSTNDSTHIIETESEFSTGTLRSTTVTEETIILFLDNESQNNQTLSIQKQISDSQSNNNINRQSPMPAVKNSELVTGYTKSDKDLRIPTAQNNVADMSGPDSINSDAKILISSQQTTGKQEGERNNTGSEISATDTQVTFSIITPVPHDSKINTAKNKSTVILSSVKDHVLTSVPTKTIEHNDNVHTSNPFDSVSKIRQRSIRNVTLSHSFRDNTSAPTNIHDHISNKNLTGHGNLSNTGSAQNSAVNITGIRRYQNRPTLTASQTYNAFTNRRSANETQFSCMNNGRGRYGDKLDCRKFYICVGRYQPIVGMCPINTVFSEYNKQCTKKLSHCIRNNTFMCTTEGRFEDYINDNMYYICIKNTSNTFARFKLQCQNGYYLNKTSLRCVFKPVLSQTTITTTSSTSKFSDSESTSTSEQSKALTHKESEKKSREKFQCEEEGKFPDHSNCRKYYYCYKNKKDQFRMKKKRCDSEEVFDEDKQKCTESSSRGC